MLNIVFDKALWKYLCFQDDLLEKSRYITRSWVKFSVRVFLYLSALSFYTITVAFTRGPQPLVGCYSIFKHHSAKSQPPHRPALHTRNKLSSSENN